METGTKLGIAFIVLAAAGAGAYFYMKSKQDEDEGDEDEDEGDSETSPSRMVVDESGLQPPLTPEQVLALKKAKMRGGLNTGKKLDVAVYDPNKPTSNSNRGGLNTGKKLDVAAPTQILGAVEGYYDGWRGLSPAPGTSLNKSYWDAWEKGQLDKAKGKPEPPKGSYGVTKGFDGLAENNPLKY
jgi:hypothetical protein